MMSGGMMAGGLMGMALAGLLGVALLLVLVLGAVWLARHLRLPAARESDGAIDIVRREYAIGRITRDEYLERSRHPTGSQF